VTTTALEDLRAVSLHGRLGNQLFQYGMLRQLVGPEQPVPVETLAVNAEPLACLLVPGTFRRLTIRESIALHRPPPLGEFARRNLRGLLRRCPPNGMVRRWMSARCIREVTRGRYDPALVAAKGPCLLQGYFQHERYVADADVFGDLRPPSDRAQQRILALRKQFGGRPLVAVLIRAAPDYAMLGWCLDVNWFLDAARMIAESVDRPAFVVFSDVPLVASAFAELLAPFGVAVDVPGNYLEPEDDLHAAIQCEHAVLSASSFAWWAGFLGDKLHGCEDRIVIAPEPWLFSDYETPRAQWRTLPSDRRADSPNNPPFI
jgi:Glycosyl transferase family 11